MADDGEQLHDLPEAFHTTPAMRAIFNGPARVRHMFAFEGALARAQARVGLVPDDVADRITSAASTVDDVDVGALAREARVAGVITVPVIKALRARVDEEARRYVHLGATSQDLVDTAFALQARSALAELVSDLVAAADACAELSRQHIDTPMVGRTLMQQAIPVTFGLKAAGWLTATARQASRLQGVRDHGLELQFGGAAGTLASLGGEGLRVAELLGEELGLAVPDLPWHADRSRVAELGSSLVITAGAMAKIAYDVVLLMQNEVGEAAESAGEGKGRSSAMPQKRNPTETLAVLTSYRLAQGQATSLLGGMTIEHERSVGSWQAEWTTLPTLFELAGSAVAGIRATVGDLEVRPDRMLANLHASGGQPMSESLSRALTSHVGSEQAHHLVSELSERAVASGEHLSRVAEQDPRVTEVLSAEELADAFDPLAYRGSAEAFVDRAVAAYERTREGLAAGGSGAHDTGTHS